MESVRKAQQSEKHKEHLRTNWNPIHSCDFVFHLLAVGGKSWVQGTSQYSSQHSQAGELAYSNPNRERNSAIPIGTALREMNLILLILGK